jgi:hypothetical protein
MGVSRNRIIFIFCFYAVILCFWGGCKSTAQHRAKLGYPDYLKPKTSEAAEYAVRERIATLEREIAGARADVKELREQIGAARRIAGEIRESSDTIRELSGRSAATLQEIIEQMEILLLWIDWATNRIQYLESLLADTAWDTSVVVPKSNYRYRGMYERAAAAADKVTRELGL